MTSDSRSLKFAEIDNVYQVIWYLLRRKYLKTTIAILALVLFAVALIPSTFWPAEPVLILSGIVIFIYLIFIRIMARRWFMRQFAVANGWQYQIDAPLSSVEGKLFKLGHSRKISDVISGDLAEHPARLFYFKYSRGHGRHRRTYNFTVLEVCFKEVEFPHILLRSCAMPRYSRLSQNETEVPLEQEFQVDFQLFSTVKYEIEALQLFSSEFLRFLKAKSFAFSLELAADRLYIYENKMIVNKWQLQEMLEVANTVHCRLRPVVERLGGHFSALHRYYR